jgi:mRNA-degrading endonuclease RelE of RelBE toxin-antitoxin system
MYNIRHAGTFEKNFKKLDHTIQEEISRTIKEKLAENLTEEAVMLDTFREKNLRD